MKEKLEALQNSGLTEIREASDLKALEDLRVKFLGKKGEITELMKGMKDLSNEERPLIGKLVNDVKDALNNALEEKFNELNEIEKNARLSTEVIDITLPGRKLNKGGLS